MLTKVSLQNFTVFSDASIAFAPGVNVFIGSNGTGKTQLLKGIYGCCESTREKDCRPFFECFRTQNSADLMRDSSLQSFGFTIECNQTNQIRNLSMETYTFGLTRDAKGKNAATQVAKISVPAAEIDAAYIPVKDMLTHAHGLLAMARKYQDFPFDKTLMDSIEKAERWIVKEPTNLVGNLFDKLVDCMGGRVVYENDEFYILKQDGQKIRFELEAEGFKKLGVLWQFLMNETILPGTVLLWDEPESNLNPEFLPLVAECLLALAAMGVQVFISTHSYILAKYIEIKMKKQPVLFHSFYIEDGLVHCESASLFSNLQHNSIMAAFETLMDEIYKGQGGE